MGERARVVVRLDQDVKVRLEVLGAISGRSLQAMVEEAVGVWVDRQWQDPDVQQVVRKVFQGGDDGGDG